MSTYILPFVFKNKTVSDDTKPALMIVEHSTIDTSSQVEVIMQYYETEFPNLKFLTIYPYNDAVMKLCMIDKLKDYK